MSALAADARAGRVSAVRPALERRLLPCVSCHTVGSKAISVSCFLPVPAENPLVCSLTSGWAATRPHTQGGVLLLTPCHETPGYTHLHARVPLVILDCSPQRPGCASAGRG